MTSEEIKRFLVMDADGRQLLHAKNSEFWLAEIAYQLAVGNEARQTFKGLEYGGVECGNSLAAPPASGIEGFEPPPLGGIPESHTFDRVKGNRFCGRCGAGEYHAIHTRTTPPNPQTSPIQSQEKP